MISFVLSLRKAKKIEFLFSTEVGVLLNVVVLLEDFFVAFIESSKRV